MSQREQSVRKVIPEERKEPLVSNGPVSHPPRGSTAAPGGADGRPAGDSSHGELHDGVDDVPAVVGEGPGGLGSGHPGLGHHELHVLGGGAGGEAIGLHWWYSL